LHGLHTGKGKTSALGFINRNGTLDVPGMLCANRCNWAHILLEVARVLDMAQVELLNTEEMSVLNGKASPAGVLF